MNLYKFLRILSIIFLILNPAMGILIPTAILVWGFNGLFCIPLGLLIVYLNVKFFRWANRLEIAERKTWVKEYIKDFDYIDTDAYYGIDYYKHPITGEIKTVDSSEEFYN